MSAKDAIGKMLGERLNSRLVDIKADANTQQAWFAATDDHRLLRYNNGSLVFVLTQ